MGLIHIDDIIPGMKLAGDVKDQTGRVLLTAGHEVTERHVRIFRMWGVIEADIEGIDRDEISASSAAHVDPEMLEDVRNRANARFRHADLEHPAMKELYRLYTQRMVQPQPGGGHHAG
jgi:hypothetical protein